MKTIERGDALAKCWVDGVPIEGAAVDQIMNLAAMPFTFKHVAVMPDCHVGMGATVGTVFAAEDVLIPAAVGVDLGCGMVAVKTPLVANQLPDNLFGMRSQIEFEVPHGRSDSGGPDDVGAWADPPDDVLLTMAALRADPRWDWVLGNYPNVQHHRVANQLGTLGTGNHFIEVCLDEHQNVWVMLHSGSRGQGNRIASHFIALAKREMERWHINLPDEDLAYLPQGSEHFGAYVKAVGWAQRYAAANRELMLARTLAAMELSLGLPGRVLQSTTAHAVNCHHNYVAREKHFGREVWVTRKGAVNAAAGQLGIIPGSMGAKSFIVRGKGNRDSFDSCSHGAGRRGSRRWARETFSVADHEAATAGVECRKDADVVDETPGAYKDIDAVMAAQTDLVEVVATLKQVLCVKG